MKKVLVLGAAGKIAYWVIDMLKSHPPGCSDVQLTLFLRHPKKLKIEIPEAWPVVQGDALDSRQLQDAVAGQDLVYANLSELNIDVQVANTVKAMHATGVKKLVFVASLGIYDEVPGKFGAWNRSEISAYLPPFRRSADAIEASGLAYTILRPAWLTNADEIDYETTERNEPFKGTEVSRKSVADLIVRIIASPESYEGRNLGVNKPGTDGDKPAFR
jgi:uncharacterized protein YbjT (DUF2867 family)